jgi:TnpA family transposase
MTAIERTAYPRFKSQPNLKELAELYTPTESELAFARAQTASKEGRFRLLISLKAFQRLGYFPDGATIPATVIEHLRKLLNLTNSVDAIAPLRSQRRYESAIRTFLQVNIFDAGARKYIAVALATAATTMDRNADLINVAIEELVKESYELPAFSTLDRLAGNIRSITNHRLFQQVASKLTPVEQTFLDELLLSQPIEGQVTLNLLKSPPKSVRLSHIIQLQSKFDKLMSFGDAQRLLAGIAKSKIQSFAAQAKALDISDFRDIKTKKRHTLLVCLLYRAQVKTRDYLVDLFLKRMRKIHYRARQRLVELREQHLKQTEVMLGVLTEILEVYVDNVDEQTFGNQVQALLQSHGGATELLERCQEITTYNSDNYLPLIRHFFGRYRPLLFELVRSLELQSTSQDRSLPVALEFVLKHEQRRSKYLASDDLDLSFISERWRRLVVEQRGEKQVLARVHLEVCIFTYLAAELKTGDISVAGSEQYADFREQLLSWDECESQLVNYGMQSGLPVTAESFVAALKQQLTDVAQTVDQICQDGTQITISEVGAPVLKRLVAQVKPPGADELEAKIWERLPERSVLDILCNVEHWLNWTRHFGLASGSEAKLDRPTERYILAVFGYGCNLGPYQTARHTRGLINGQMLSRINRLHIQTSQIEAAMRELINAYNLLPLPKCWGTGKRAAADGSKFQIHENSLMSEYHIRYGGYGGIAYHHVSDTYIALFTHFITCGVWEAVYILDGLLKNSSDIQPDTLHADTQGQSVTVFALSYLLGIKLMPRIRNWQDYTFFRPTPEAVYEYIDPLFTDVVDWKLIQTHWQDLIRVTLSIQAGKLMPSTILRRLGSNSRKNRLYQAFQALGQVVRTLFLLQYISDRALRQEITACTNIVEGYHNFLDWLFFGKQGVITDHDPEEQEKRLKYLDLVASAVIFQNTVDISTAVRSLVEEGHQVDRELLATLSPYLTRHLKRYGDYVVDLTTIPEALDLAVSLPIDLVKK